MSQHNLESATQALLAASEFDAARLLELTDPEVEWHSFFALGSAVTYRGHEALVKYADDLREAWDFLRARVEDDLAVGNLVLLVGHLRGRGRGSGAETEIRAGWMFKFRNGRVISFRAVPDPEAILEAAFCVSEQDAHADS